MEDIIYYVKDVGFPITVALILLLQYHGTIKSIAKGFDRLANAFEKFTEGSKERIREVVKEELEGVCKYEGRVEKNG